MNLFPSKFRGILGTDGSSLVPFTDNLKVNQLCSTKLCMKEENVCLKCFYLFLHLFGFFPSLYLSLSFYVEREVFYRLWEGNRSLKYLYNLILNCGTLQQILLIITTDSTHRAKHRKPMKCAQCALGMHAGPRACALCVLRCALLDVCSSTAYTQMQVSGALVFADCSIF